MDHQRINQLIAMYRDGLLNDVVPFWQEHAVDRECGGFLTYLDRDGTVLSTDKPVWVLGRFTWLLAHLYNEVETRDQWLDLARHGIDFMLAHAFDSDGRMFYSLTREGRPLRKRRYLFTETFGVIALAEYALASGDVDALARAFDLYKLILMYYRTPGLLPPKVIPSTRAAKAHAMPMIVLATTQALRRAAEEFPRRHPGKSGVCPHSLFEDVIQRSLDEVLNDFVKPEKHALLETVGPHGEFMDTPEGRCVNPGHAIESSWFIMEEARRRSDTELVRGATRILEWSLKIGWDEKFGGILYFVDVDGKPAEPYEHDMKLWWPHTEALYALLLAHHLTGEAKYEQWYDKVHEWTFSHFPDPDYGEWIGYLHRDGTVSSPVKGNMWKGPFHVPRALLYCWRLLEEMRGEKRGHSTFSSAKT